MARSKINCQPTILVSRKASPGLFTDHIKRSSVHQDFNLDRFVMWSWSAGPGEGMKTNEPAGSRFNLQESITSVSMFSWKRLRDGWIPVKIRNVFVFIHHDQRKLLFHLLFSFIMSWWHKKTNEKRRLIVIITWSFTAVAILSFHELEALRYEKTKQAGR